MQEAEVKEESNATVVSRSGKRQAKPVDPDPHGEKLLQVLCYISIGVVQLVMIKRFLCLLHLGSSLSF